MEIQNFSEQYKKINNENFRREKDNIKIKDSVNVLNIRIEMTEDRSTEILQSEKQREKKILKK